MSQKTKEIDKVFSPSSFGVVYYEEPKDADFHDEKKKQAEEDVYKEVVLGLEGDLKNIGMDLTYSSKIIIREVAMNIVLLNRVKFEIICKGLLRDKKILKQDFVSYKQTPYSQKYSKSISYDVLHVHGDEEIHPLFDKYLPKLQKQINEGLKALALLPVQQIERQKLTIIKKLKQRYKDVYGEISVEAKTEKNIHLKKIYNNLQNPRSKS